MTALIYARRATREAEVSPFALPARQPRVAPTLFSFTLTLCGCVCVCAVAAASSSFLRAFSRMRFARARGAAAATAFMFITEARVALNYAARGAFA